MFSFHVQLRKNGKELNLSWDELKAVYRGMEEAFLGVVCPKCGKKYKNKQNLRNHKSKVHKTEAGKTRS